MASTPFGRREFLTQTAGSAAQAATAAATVLRGARPAGAAKAQARAKSMKLAMAVSYDDEVNTSKQQEQQLIDRVFTDN